MKQCAVADVDSDTKASFVVVGDRQGEDGADTRRQVALGWANVSSSFC
jgi:hypothetical protein